MATAMSSRRTLLDPRARMRVAGAKRLVAVGCIAAFGAAFALTKVSHPSHAKHPLKRLSAPDAFLKQLRDNQLRGGVVAPAQAPPEAQTAGS
ncbi:MAG TPA: hypothetical protein VH300_07850 [Thermoleophilaceae bacterium]|nr:hypothetical protein [Thermoleophilaceae bacterium]